MIEHPLKMIGKEKTSEQVDLETAIDTYEGPTLGDGLFCGKFRKLNDPETTVTYPLGSVVKSTLNKHFDFLMEVDGEIMYICSKDLEYEFNKLKEFCKNNCCEYKIINVHTGKVTTHAQG
jgi:hypothetical protein